MSKSEKFSKMTDGVNSTVAVEAVERTTTVVRVAICVITFRRPQGLAALLKSLGRLEFTAEVPSVKIVIVENESEGPAAAVCQRLRSNVPFPIECHIEQERGIPHARNTAIEAAGDVEYIAFVDDDEVVDPLWLDQLLSVAQQYDAHVVAAPTVSVFPDGVSEWVERGRFHIRRRHPTGTRLTPMASGNCLLQRAMLDRMEPCFDARFALTGGSDAHFFRRVARAGFKCVWADEAVVWEAVPLSRTTPHWIWMRAFRSGANYGFMLSDFEPRWRVAWLVIRDSGKHLGWGLVGMLVAPFRGRHAVVKQVEHLYRGTGMLSGYLGRQHEEYRTIHGQ